MISTLAVLPALAASPDESLAQSAPPTTPLEVVASFTDKVPVGVAVSPRGRVFVTLPFSNYSSAPHPASVVEVLPDRSTRPYPSAAWNRDPSTGSEDPGGRFLNVQSATVDRAGFLWLLDTGNPKRAGVVPGGPKLVRVDLSTDTVAQVVPLPSDVLTPGTFINDVRVDPDRAFAYVSETGDVGGLIALDLRTGKARKIPSVDLPTRTEQVNGPTWAKDGWGFPDGLVLDATGDTLYFHATSGPTMFRIPTAALRDFTLTSAEAGRRAETVAETVRTDGMHIDEGGWIYHSDFTRKAVSRWRPGESGVEIVAHDPRLVFPDAIATGPDGYVYFSDPQFPNLKAMNNKADTPDLPFRVYRAKLPAPAP